MTASLADDNFKCIFLNQNDRTLIRISMEFVPRSPIDNKPALVQAVAWHRTGDKPLAEPMLTQFTDIYEALGRDELKAILITSPGHSELTFISPWAFPVN